MISAGDTFIIPDPGRTLDKHLWILISDPDKDPDRVVLVSMTTYRRHQEDVCIIERGEHPFVDRKSCIHYRDAKEVSAAKISHLLETGLLERHHPLGLKLLQRVRAGAALSKRFPLERAEILIEQGLLDLSP
jgi:hypothetical protein